MRKPPFLFRFRFFMRQYYTKFSYDVVALNNTEAQEKAYAMLADGIKPLVESGELTPGDARPLYYEVTVVDIKNEAFLEEEE